VAWGKVSRYLIGIRRHVLRHLRIQWEDAEVVRHAIGRRGRADMQIALDALRDRHLKVAAVRDGPTRFGIRHLYSLSAAVENNVEPKPIEWDPLPAGPGGKTLRCARSALYLLSTRDGRPFVATIHPSGTESPAQFIDDDCIGRSIPIKREVFDLEVAAADQNTATAALAELQELASQKSVYRGHILSLEAPTPEDISEGEPFVVRFSDMPEVDRSRIVLPDDVMRVVERNVLGLLEHRETLHRVGRSTRHGVLFHGPPGVGKTLVTKFLARAATGYTVILLTGRHLKFVRESCRLAKLLAPSMVVMEDVDLVASERGENRNTTLLHELMDEMDGLGSKSDTIFILTTNRPDILEPALAARPGRVDQAIYFPLPDLASRRRLFELFSNGLYLAGVDVENLLQRTEGASPAFIEELFRKAVLFAAERGERVVPMPMEQADFDQALRELVEFGGALTRSLLGFSGSSLGNRDRS
jgi:SpoVK/Ycf46/Vps4 family AAA+-type ATPase